MTTISYAQAAEDIVLRRAFPGARGVYVDIGGGNPNIDNVTRLFHEAGWDGVNVEPQPEFFAEFERSRPTATNLNVGVSDQPGELTFWQADAEHYGLSTFSPDTVERWHGVDVTFTEKRIPVITLDEVLSVAPSRVDILKIDVEGWEERVLRGGRLESHQPRAIVIEAVGPRTHERNSASWEPILLRAGYVATLFDGLNLFFARRDEPRLVEALMAPANLFDDWVPNR